MGSTSMNPGVSDLLQTLSNFNTPALSSPAVASALENAPASDIVQLSAEATQLEGVEAMFGVPPSSNDSPGGLSSVLASLESSVTGSGDPATAASSGASSSSTPEVAQLANYQGAMMSNEIQTLLGGGSSSTTGSLFDLTG